MATDTTSTTTKNARIISNIPNTNFSASMTAGNFSGSDRRALISFTLPSLSGTITAIKLKLYTGGEIRSGGTHSVHTLNQSAWSQTTSTWNVYSTGNSWSVAGGDFNASPIFTSANTAGLGAGTLSYDLYGGSALNPISLPAWGSDIHLLLKVTSGTSEIDFAVKEDATPANRPYLEITYTAGGASTSQFFF